MRDADEERMADALKPRSGSDARLDFLVRSALKEAAEKAKPKEWSQERQDFLVQSALKEAAAKRRRTDCQPRQ